MKTITLGEKFVDKKFDFRETCFGICERDNKILLTKKIKKNKGYDMAEYIGAIKKNEIAMVGGGLEAGESHHECLKREFIEESGYTVESIEELCTVDCYWLAGGSWPMESLANFYIIKLSKDCITPTEEGHEPVWVSIDEVEDMLPLPYHKEAIRQYLSLKEAK